MKKILITGSSGYIGSHLCKLLENEYEVHGLDLADPRVPVKHFIKQDINRIFEMEHEYDAVIHLAALVRVSESEEKPISYYITNLNGTMNVLNRAKTNNFIFASTGVAEYCNNPYAISKRGAEDVVKEYCAFKQRDYTIFRFYNVVGSTVVGPTNPDGLLYKLLEARETGEFTIYGKDYTESPDGTCVRDYVHVNEICNALRKAIDKPSNQVECLGHGRGRTVAEIARIFKQVNNCNFEVKYGPRRKGDLPSSVLKDVSPYMEHMYSTEDLFVI